MSNSRRTRFFLAVTLAVGIGVETRAEEVEGGREPRAVDFAREIQPIFREHCFECHGSGNQEAGLNLAVREHALRGGDSGAAVTPGDSRESLLLQLVSGSDPDRIMPPEGSRLEAAQIALLRDWVDQGAQWPREADVRDTRRERAREHWAFQPLRSPEAPNVDLDWGATPIDQFIARKYSANQLTPTAPIDARRLARRIHFGLIGLPPTPEQLQRFEEAAERDRAVAVEELVDRLLGSRHYGERWARHWLDVVRYADSDGQEADRDRPHAYHYRDFVIQAFNQDLPFDQFVRWQIAGDELDPENSVAVIATGFLTAGTNTVLEDSFLEEERLRNRYNELDDIVATLGTSMLGLTLGCARCHDHKFDAVSAREYYQLLSAFHSGDRRVGELPDGGEGLFFGEDVRRPKTTWLFERADFYDRDEEVSLAFPAVLVRDAPSPEYWMNAAPTPDVVSTFQRAALARWITDVQHGAGPLLARVIVNRLWHHHFGHGLARTNSDFGVRGEPPTHPDLLEWLAHDFIAHGWRIKRLQRMIVRSAVYQQGVAWDAAKHDIDPANRFLWRRTPQRLEAEILRDAMLAISGTLNLTPYGPGFKPFIPPEAILARNLQEGGYPSDARDNHQTRRRSVYMFHKRLVPYPLFQVFDRPDLLQACARRENTTVAPEALALLNDAFVRARAEDFADQLLTAAGNDQQVVRDAFEQALGRGPTADELAAAVAFLRRQHARRQPRNDEHARPAAVADFCQSIFALNEFLYVD